MRRPGPDATLAGIYISVHTQPNTHPVKTEWVDEALAGANAAGTPLGALIGRPLALGDGIMLVGWPEGGPGQYHVIETRPGRGRGPARYMQVVKFSGPRSEEWVAAEEQAAAGRLGPATEGIDGIVSVMRRPAGHRREPGMTTTTLVGAGTWTADTTRTRVRFAARHLFYAWR